MTPGELPHFRGNDRFQLRRQLGKGSMGVVWDAWDAGRGHAVALKTLVRGDPTDIARFKREFRSLERLQHPNLVHLYDLVHHDGWWFFTMELIYGVPLLEFIRGEFTARNYRLDGDAAATSRARSRSVVARPIVERVRQTLPQLTEAVRAIHNAGLLHRDLKPTNVLVTDTGRVVVLDFGLAVDVPAGASAVEDSVVAGTPAYMAPEQLSGGQVGPAADWYSVGTMLHVALTGALPFTGGVEELMSAKLREDAPPPSALADGVPPDLDGLCSELLRREPALRPGGGDVAARCRLLGTPSASLSALPIEARHVAAPFAGRRRELAQLVEAVDHVRSGGSAVLRVSGARGSGKTRLIEELLDDSGRVQGFFVLRGRCHPQESLPYNALDAAVDDLAERMRRMPTAQLHALLPRDVDPLLRLFPALGRCEALLRAPRVAFADGSPALLRDRAFGAFAELLGRLSDRQPLLLWIDDVQWSDADSRDLLQAVLSAPLPLHWLLLLSMRDDEGGSTLDDLRPTEDTDLLRVAIAPLSSPVPSLAPERVRSGALRALLHDIDPAGRRFLSVLAVAQAALPLRVALRASVSTGDAPALRELQARGIVRVGRRADQEFVEARRRDVVEAAVAGLAEEDRRRLHEAVAEALSAEAMADDEALATQWRAAGHSARAAHHGARAAEHAMKALAFDRGAALLERAIADGGGSLALYERLADAREESGRWVEALSALEAARSFASEHDLGRLGKRAFHLALRSARVRAAMRDTGRESHGLFEGLRGAVVRRLVAEGHMLELEPQKLLSRAGDVSDGFYVVLAGSVEGGLPGEEAGRFGEGAVIGATDWLLGQPRRFSLRAGDSGAQLLALGTRALEHLAELDPAVALRLLTNLARLMASRIAELRRAGHGATDV